MLIDKRAARRCRKGNGTQLFPLFCLSMVPLSMCLAQPGTAQDVGATKASANSTAPIVHIHPRYYRWYVNPGQQWTEKNTGYAFLDWKIPRSQAALVLVDVWDRHYIKDPETRAEKIIQERIRPLVAACRRAGLQVIHAPSPELAELEPGWIGCRKKPEKAAKPAPKKSTAGCSNAPPPRDESATYIDFVDVAVHMPSGQTGLGSDTSWPPLEFRSKTGHTRSSPGQGNRWKNHVVKS